MIAKGLKAAGIGVALLGLAACGALPGGGPAPDLYDLSPKSSFGSNTDQVPWQLVVEEPRASRAFDSDKIALRPTPVQLKYYAGARWTDRAPRMVQRLLVESFENSERIVGVGRQAIGLRSDYTLRSELREFQALYNNGTEDAPLTHIRLNCKLIQHPSARIIASATFEAKVRANSNRMEDIIGAFDHALGKVLKRTVIWTLDRGGVRPSEADKEAVNPKHMNWSWEGGMSQ